jgi:hypothetical protein
MRINGYMDGRNQRLTDDYHYVDATQPATLNLVLVF